MCHIEYYAMKSWKHGALLYIYFEPWHWSEVTEQLQAKAWVLLGKEPQIFVRKRGGP